MDLRSFEPEVLLNEANVRHECHASEVFRMAGALVSRGNTIQEAVRLAKQEWLRLLADHDLAEQAALPPHEQPAAVRALRRLEDRR